MATNKPKVFAYLPQELYNQVVQFKLDNELRSDSQALLTILEQFFNQPAANPSQTSVEPNKVEQRLNTLEARLAELASQFGDIIRRLQRLEELPDEVVEVSPLESVSNGSVLSELPSEPLEIIAEEQPEPEPSSVPSELPSEPLEIIAEEQEEEDKFVICRYNDSSPKALQFWDSRRGEFSYSFTQAKRYQSEKVANRQVLKILQDDQHFTPDRGWVIKYDSVAAFHSRLKEIRPNVPY